jgi:circadian clock protein KaiC
MPKTKEALAEPRMIPKSKTGITGLDEITFGGLPKGRPTLICGGAGAGKTMFAAEFIVRGAMEFNEPGVFMMFEENAEELTENVRSLGFDLDALVKKKKISLDHVHIERSEIEETGEYDLEGLFIRLGYAIDSIGAKRVVLDTLEALFAGLPNHAILRAELRRLFRWLKDRNMTAVITGERGEKALTRYGLEEYVADCVILLDNRVDDQLSTRRLRIVKYRGSQHGTNEYPFIIGRKGISVLPITSLRLDHTASKQFVPTGVDELDRMLSNGKGVYRGSTVLISGAPGTGKSSLAATFANAACERGERALLFAYEESADQILRNMRSIGMDLNKWVSKGLLKIHASRPTLQGLEQHLVMMYDEVLEFKPKLVIVDPISNLAPAQNEYDVKPTLMRLIDLMKSQQITSIFTSLTHEDYVAEAARSEVGISSLMDTWLLIKNTEHNGERNRTMLILKSRGMAHSNQVREFVMSNKGIDLIDPYLGTDKVLTGTARIVQTEHEAAATRLREQERERELLDLETQRKTLRSKIEALNAEAASLDHDAELLAARNALQDEVSAAAARRIATSRAKRDSNGTAKAKRR